MESLEDLIGLAAVKNSEFTRNPRRSNCLAQTLLQRRHWFHLMEIHDKQQASRTATPVASPVCPKRDSTAIQPTTSGPSSRPMSPFPNRKRSCSAEDQLDGGDPGAEKLSVLVLEVDPSNEKVIAKKRRRVAVTPTLSHKRSDVVSSEG